MQEQMKMTATDLGMQLLPAFSALLGVGSKIVSGIGSVVKVFSSLPAPVKTVILVLAGVAAAAGPALIILAKLLPVIRAMPAVLGMLKTGLMGLINPYTLVAAAAAAFVIISLQVADAQAKAEASSRIAAAANYELQKKLAAAAQEAGKSAAWFGDLNAKYKDNATAMAMAIQKGKEGIEIQQALAKVGAEHAAVIEKERAALAAKAQAQQDELTLTDKQKASAEAMEKMRVELTASIAQSAMSEYQYTKFSLEQQYLARKKDINDSLVSTQEKNALLLQAQQTYNAQILAFEAKQGVDLIDLAMQQRTAWTEIQKAANLEYLTLRQGLQAEMLQLGTVHLADEIALLNLEKAAKIKAIQDDKLLNQTQKDELLAMLTDYYAQKQQLARDDADIAVQCAQSWITTASQLMSDFTGDMMDAFYRMGEGSKSFGESAKEAFKNLASGAINSLKKTAMEAVSSAVTKILAAEGTAIASVIASVMSLPFPLNLAVVGGAIAAVSALFHRIKLGEGGLVTGPTTALIGEKGPELVVPLKKLGGLFKCGGQGQGVTLQQTLHFHGNINSSYSVDEISRILGERTVQAIEKGRRF